MVEAAEFLDRTGRQWSPFIAWTLENPSFDGDPFDLEATATFVHGPSGESHTTGMFYDGGDTWKFRFTATRPGEWTFTTRSADPDLDGRSGTVRVEPNQDGVGFMVPDGHKWCRQVGVEGERRAFVPQFVMYTPDLKFLRDHPEHLEGAIRTFLEGHGFSGFHLPCIGGRWFDLDADSLVTVQMTDPDPRSFAVLEDVILRTHRAGGVVHVWPWGDRQRRWTPTELEGGINGPVDRRLQRYIAARLGPLPGWSMGYGFDLQEWVDGERVKAWRDYVQGRMGWFHFLGGRAGGPTGGTDHSRYVPFNEPLDYAGYQHWKPTYQVYVAALEAIPGKPVMSEDRFRIRSRGKDYTMEETRRGLWHSAMAGGVANIWGNLKPEAKEGGSSPYPRPEWIRTWATFFEGRFARDLVRDNALTDGVCLRSPGGERCVLYKEDAISLMMDLPATPRALPAVAVDAKRAYAELPLGELPPGRRTWQAPYASDWAVAVGDFGGE